MTAEAFPDAYFGGADARIPSKDEVLRGLAPFKRPLKAFIEALPEGARVLDVGCGQGKTLKMLLALRPDVKAHGMDISDVRAHLPSEVSFKQGDLEQLSELYAGESFDAVICQHVIEHLVYPMGLMNAMNAVLRGGGTLYLETPNWTRLFAPFSHFYFYNDYTHVRPFSRMGMTRLLLDFSFEKLAIRTLSSCTWLTPARVSSGKTGAREKTSDTAQHTQGLIARVLARLVNPLMRDVLIAIAVKHGTRS